MLKLFRNPFRRQVADPFSDKIDGSAVLAKAASDHWQYVVALRSGLIVHCREVDHRGDWLKLNGIEDVLLSNGRELLKGDFLWGRGIECRVPEVAADADCDS